jgi:hypothetical protein
MDLTTSFLADLVFLCLSPIPAPLAHSLCSGCFARDLRRARAQCEVLVTSANRHDSPLAIP